MNNVYVINVVEKGSTRYNKKGQPFIVREIGAIGISNDRQNTVDIIESGRDLSDNGRYGFLCLEKVSFGLNLDEVTDKIWYDLSVVPHAKCDAPTEYKNSKRIFTRGP